MIHTDSTLSYTHDEAEMNNGVLKFILIYFNFCFFLVLMGIINNNNNKNIVTSVDVRKCKSAFKGNTLNGKNIYMWADCYCYYVAVFIVISL